MFKKSNKHLSQSKKSYIAPAILITLFIAFSIKAILAGQIFSGVVLLSLSLFVSSLLIFNHKKTSTKDHLKFQEQQKLLPWHERYSSIPVTYNLEGARLILFVLSIVCLLYSLNSLWNSDFAMAVITFFGFVICSVLIAMITKVIPLPWKKGKNTSNKTH
jgi:hypothetical protein